MSLWTTGKVSMVNESAAALGVQVRMSAQEAASIKLMNARSPASIPSLTLLIGRFHLARVAPIVEKPGAREAGGGSTDGRDRHTCIQEPLRQLHRLG